jgi:RNA-dependent RNA polymerase
MPNFTSNKGAPLRDPSTNRRGAAMIPEEMRTSKPASRQPHFQVQGSSSYGRPVPGKDQRQRATPNTQAPRAPLAQLTGPAMKVTQPWQAWTELTVRVANLPPSMTTWQLWKRFSREGNIVLIELFEDRHGVREPNAKIRFSPVPQKDFWNQKAILISTPDGEGTFQIKMEVLPTKRNNRVPSPIRKSVFYPEVILLRPSIITFGLMYDENTMMSHYDAPSLEHNDTSFAVELLRNRITARFPLKFENFQSGRGVSSDPSWRQPRQKEQNYMFQIPFGQLDKIYRVELNEHQWALIVNVHCPPQFFRRRPVEASHSDSTLIWTEFDTYLRQTDIVHDREHLKISPVALNKAKPMIDIGRMSSTISISLLDNNTGRWTTYRFVFDKVRNEKSLSEKMVSALRDFNIEVEELAQFSLIPGFEAPVWSLLDPAKTQTTGTDLDILDGIDAADYNLPFEVRYQLEACISENCINEYNITPEFIKVLHDMARKDVARVILLLEHILERDQRVYDPMSIFMDNEAMNQPSRPNIPNYCAISRKATITPTTMYLSSPTVEPTNRVIREFSPFGDRFLRVQFTDEKFEVC